MGTASSKAAGLPSLVPLFPLPNVVLFPRMAVPLHVFEPRYRDMVRDALAGDRVIGMVLLRGDWQSDYDGRPEIFPIGTAGRIVRHEPLPDGRCNIVLAGAREFGIECEFDDRSYRYARVCWREGTSEPLVPSTRERLLALASEYLERRGPAVWGDVLRRPSRDDEVLVNAMCQTVEVPVIEKQLLLEADSLEARAQQLRKVIEFCLADVAGPSGTAGGGYAH